MVPLSTSVFFYCSLCSVFCWGKAHRQLQWTWVQQLGFWALPHCLIFLVFSSALADFNLSFPSKNFSADGAEFLCWTESELPSCGTKNGFFCHLCRCRSGQVLLWSQYCWFKTSTVLRGPCQCEVCCLHLFQRGLNTGVSGVFHSCCSSQGTKIWSGSI